MNLVNEITQSEYGEHYKDHLFEQYKILVDSADKISDRRYLTNNLFYGINTGLFTLIGLSFSNPIIIWMHPLLYLIGFVISVLTWLLVNSYKQLNSGKFKLVHEIEAKLPLAMYQYEWKVLGEGKDKSKYYPFSHIELHIILAIGILYLILLGSELPSLMSALISNTCKGF